jgi:Middle or third domain of peptidase_M16
VTDALNEYSYDADLAGLVFSFDPSSLGFCVSVSGYNDKLHVLLRDVLVKAKDVEVRADRLNVMIEKVNDVSSDTRLIKLDILCIDQTRLGELFPWSNLSNIRLLRTLPYEREAVDNSRETTGPGL